MKALSLWQPWAHLVKVGAKRFETRSWATHHRGAIAIHAAGKFTREFWGICQRPAFARALAPAFGPCRSFDSMLMKMELKCVVAVAQLVGCSEITSQSMREHGIEVGSDEQAFGDWRPGRFMWRLEEVVPLARPLVIGGRQRLFDVPDHMLAEAA